MAIPTYGGVLGSLSPCEDLKYMETKALELQVSVNTTDSRLRVIEAFLLDARNLGLTRLPTGLNDDLHEISYLGGQHEDKILLQKEVNSGIIARLAGYVLGRETEAHATYVSQELTRVKAVVLELEKGITELNQRIECAINECARFE